MAARTRRRPQEKSCVWKNSVTAAAAAALAPSALQPVVLLEEASLRRLRLVGLLTASRPAAWSSAPTVDRFFRLARSPGAAFAPGGTGRSRPSRQRGHWPPMLSGTTVRRVPAAQRQPR